MHTMNPWIRLTPIVASAALIAAMACPATAALAAPSQAPSAFSVKAFPAAAGQSHPDDITRLGDSIYVAYQNGVGSKGEPSATGATASTIQQYSLAGVPGASWSITGKIDGMGADKAGKRLLVTTNEDGNSSFHTVSPGSGADAVKNFAYTGLTHGGGTDAATVYQGKIFITASAPSGSTGPAVYTAKLSGTTAALTPVFADDAVATAANGTQAGMSVSLTLSDPDSSTVVPAASPRFRNEFLLDGQGDQQLVFVKRAGTPRQSLHVLNLNQQVDDTAFATHADQTLWITDPDHNTVYSVSGPFKAGQAVSTVTPDSAPNYLSTLDLADGSLTAISDLAAIHPKGLLFTSSH